MQTEFRRENLHTEEISQWIYECEDRAAYSFRLDEIRKRSAEETVVQGAWVSRKGLEFAAYFLKLPGDVLTLGGMRSELPAHRSARLLQQILTGESSVCSQLQAVVPESDNSRLRPILASSFENVTQVLHIFRPIRKQPKNTPARQENRIRLVPVNAVQGSVIQNIIVETFVDTHDCPELNGIRTPEQVLDGFLDGQSLEEISDWYVLKNEDGIIGCALCAHHKHTKLLELVYMGVIPSARRRGIGRLAVKHLLEHAAGKDCIGVAAAVDERNTPAIGLYHSMGFESHARFEIWLGRRHAIHQRMTA